MTRKFFLTFIYLFALVFFAFAQTAGENQKLVGLQKVDNKIANIEFNTNGVDIEISLHNEKFIGYKIEEQGQKISIVKSKKKLQFYTVAPTDGSIFIYLPNDFLLESCRVQALNSKIVIEKIKSIYFVFSGSYSNIIVKNSKFKNVLVASTHSNIEFSAGIVSVADFCLNYTRGKVEIAENKENCNLFITQTKNEKFLFKGKSYTKAGYSYEPKKTKKYITMSLSFSELEVNFISPFDEPIEKFNEYGISEFGPKPAPNLIDPVSNFLPKKNE